MTEELRENTESSDFVCVRLTGSKSAEPSEKPESNAPAAETSAPETAAPVDLNPEETVPEEEAPEPEIQAEPIDLNPEEAVTEEEATEPIELNPVEPSGPIELNPSEEVPEEPAEPEEPAGPIELNPIEEAPEEPVEPEEPAGPIELNPIEKMPSILAEAEKASGPVDLNPAEDTAEVIAERKKQLSALEVSSEKNLPAVIDKPSSPDNASETAENSKPKKHFWEKRNRSGKVSIVFLLTVLFGLLAIVLFIFGTFRGIGAVRAAFDQAKAAAAGVAYQAFYGTSYDAAEHDYHVKNRALITLSGIRETAELEVLSVSDIVYITKDKNDIFDTPLWLQVPGTGVFTLDLAAGEFLVDNERRSVYVRLPKPDLTTDNIKIDHKNVEILNMDSSAIASSAGDGERLVQEQLNEALVQIREDIMSNLEYYKYAEESARSLLETWIRSVNKDVEDLTVEIEFY